MPPGWGCEPRAPQQHPDCNATPAALPPPPRSITLCCRDVVNLSIAAGGVCLDPVWDALAQRLK